MLWPSGLAPHMIVLFSQIHCYMTGWKTTMHSKMGICWVTVAIRVSHFWWHHMEILQMQNRKLLTRPIARQGWPLNKPLVDGNVASTYFIPSAEWIQKKCAFSLVLVQCFTTFLSCSMIILMMILLMTTNLSWLHIMGLMKADYFEITFAIHFFKLFIDPS